MSHNKQFASPDYEIVLVLDEPSEEAGILELCSETPDFRWKVLINREEHEWRNPAKPLNVGIRQARSETVLVVSPETTWVTNVPGILLKNCMERPKGYHFGSLQGNHAGRIPTAREFDLMMDASHCGSICVRKEHLEAINGYDESLVGWGGDDDNLRARLWRVGVMPNHDKEARLVHPIHRETARVYSQDTKNRIKEIVRPTEAIANVGLPWGQDFSEVIFEN